MDLKKKLIANGLKHLNSVGVNNFSIRKVASQSGVSHNAPYKHFKNRDIFIQSILGEAVNSFNIALNRAIEDLDTPRERLVSLGIGYIEFFIENPEIHKLLLVSEGKGRIYIGKDRFDDSEVYLFKYLKSCIKEFLEVINKSDEYTDLMVLDYWVTVDGYTSFLVNKKIQADNSKAFIKELITRIVDRV